MEYRAFFQRATGNAPYPYQERLAAANPWPDLLEAPTGAGKTEAIVLAWLWRRRYTSLEVRAVTPRRLAYTLPMRVLVEQTEKRVRGWLTNLTGLGDLSGFDQVGVEILMGGETDNDWDLYPEREAVLIGTQDMLLSRALNRGYALGRARWPLPYGLLNNDCLWVFDEIQLMGSGLATTAQLAAFREKFRTWGNCPSLWVSATLRPDWLATVDFRDKVEGLTRHELMKSEWHDSTSTLTKRLKAKKVLNKAKATADKPNELAEEILTVHKNGELTLVVVNTVKKAIELYNALKPAPKRGKKATEKVALPAPDLLLLHSRFRALDRQAKMTQLLSPVPELGRIVVSTQVVEAGVDISARAMFTELSPWASFVQRVGRCNRKGEFKSADVFWLDVDTKKRGNAAPYEDEELDAARAELKKLEDAGPRTLRDYLDDLSEPKRKKLYPYTLGSVVRKKDIVELFDTTADLTGADVDVSRFIREADDHDVQVFWRMWEGKDPNVLKPQPEPDRDELCTAPLNKEGREWLNKHKKYRWDFLEKRWQLADTLTPGQMYLLHVSSGGYSNELGWDITSKEVLPLQPQANKPPDSNNDERQSTRRKVEQTIAEHTNQVVEELEKILSGLSTTLTVDEQTALRHAARWHDWGKAHSNFQKMLTDLKFERTLPAGHLWAKSKTEGGKSERPGFRHELASALAMLKLGHPDLACYIVAAHHGKVRLSIRSLPTEKHPEIPTLRFARGVWEGDPLPVVNLGGKVVAPEVILSLAPMELGLIDGQPSWAERVLNLREQFGPFRLVYLEALLRAADMRASANPRPGGEE